MAKHSKIAKRTGKGDNAKFIDNALLGIVLAILIIAPLLVHMASINHVSPLITGTAWDGGTASDFFSYYQFAFTILGTVIALGLFLYKMLVNKFSLKASYINVFVAVLFLLVALSTVFAKYKTFSVFGQYDIHQGSLAYLTYLLLFVITANLELKTKQAKWFIYAMYPFIVVNFILGMLYFLGYNILQSPTILASIVPGNLSGGLSAGSYISSTVANPDFISGMGGVCTVLFLSKGILEKQLSEKIVSIILAIMSFSMILTSHATSGFFTLVVLTPLVLVVMLLSRTRKQGSVTAGVALLCLVLVFLAFNARDPLVWGKSVGFFVHTGTQVHSPVTTGKSTSKSSQAKSQGTSDEFNLPPLAWSAGTGRTYIWSKTVGLIKQRPLLGYGLDTLSYVFPQDDPGKASGLDNPDTIVDKPHNMYLGLAFGAGILALLAFLMLLVRHALANLKLFKARFANDREVLAVVLFLGWCAFLVQAVFNDPTTGTSLIFWILFGVSVTLLDKPTESSSKS